MKPITPLLTVDAIIIIDSKILLIERKHEPHGWALPGGFVDVGETVEAALHREVLEETNLNVISESLFGIYSDPNRDKRGHTVSIVYAVKTEGIPKAADDAKSLELFPFDNLPSSIAFDHAKILNDFSPNQRLKSNAEF